MSHPGAERRATCPKCKTEYTLPDDRQYQCPTCNVLLQTVQVIAAASDKKGQFKAMFKKDKVVAIATITGALGVGPATSIPSLLQEWKLAPYFDVRPPNVARNDKPMPWERAKEILKKVGKQALVRGVPIAIGLLTGGAGLGVALGPVIGGIIAKLRQAGLKVPDAITDKITDVVKGNADDAVKSLVDKIAGENPDKSAGGGACDVADTIKLVLGEELFPVVSEIKTVIGTLSQQKGDLKEIFEGWMDEQREALDTLQASQSGIQDSIDAGFQFTRDELARIDDEIGTRFDQLSAKLDTVISGQAQTTAMLGRMEKGIESFLKEVCAGDFTARSLDEWFQISRVQFQQADLAGKFGEPFDPALFVETPSLDMAFQSFVTQSGYARPLFLLLANIGMGKTWNAVHLGKIMQQSRLAIPFFISLHHGFEQLLNSIFSIKGGDPVQRIGEICNHVARTFDVKILLLFDGLDELPKDRQDLLNFLDLLLTRHDQQVLVMLTDRITDWVQHDRMPAFHKNLHDTDRVYSEPGMDNVESQLDLLHKISAYLSGFTSTQLAMSIARYGLDPAEFAAKPGLAAMCTRPYVLRLVKERELYPDPSDPDAFMPLFFNAKNPLNTILHRMSITASTQTYFFDIVKFFGKADAVKTMDELASKTNSGRDQDWQVIKFAGIVVEEVNNFSKSYRFDPIFQPVLQRYLNIVNGKIEQDNRIALKNGIKVKLEPKLRTEGVIINCQKPELFKKKQIYIALSTKAPKIYSFMIRVDDIRPGEGTILILEADKRRVGILNAGDFVDLYPCVVPDADLLVIGITDSYKGIMLGNWAASFKSFLKDKAIEGGDVVNCPVPIDKDTMIIQGTVIDSRPRFPVKVGIDTVIEVKKLLDLDLVKLTTDIEQLKASRTTDIEKMMMK